jgi:hypothetical protein
VAILNRERRKRELNTRKVRKKNDDGQVEKATDG